MRFLFVAKKTKKKNIFEGCSFHGRVERESSFVIWGGGERGKREEGTKEEEEEERRTFF